MSIGLYAAISSGIIIAIFVAAYYASFIAQYIWAWIDDSKPLKGNVLSRFVSMKIKMTK